MEPQTFTNLGGKERKPDPRDYLLKTDLGSATPTPATFMQDRAFAMPIYYQGQQPACGAHSGAWLAAFLDETQPQSYTPRYQWIDIKSFDNFAIADGTTMDAIFKSLMKGSLAFDKLGNDVTLSLTEYASQKAVSASMKASASQKPIYAYGYHNQALTFQALKDLIYQHGAIEILMGVGSEFWTAANGQSSWAEKDILPLRVPKTIVSGHFVVAHSFDEKYIYFANSFSNLWGRKGHGYFGENYLPKIIEVGTIIDSTEKVTIPLFTKDLYLGVTDPQVRTLQKWLNANGFPVALSGAGSTGNETDYFGSLTQKALIAFQKAKGISPTSGYFGSITRGYIANNT